MIIEPDKLNELNKLIEVNKLNRPNHLNKLMKWIANLGCSVHSSNRVPAKKTVSKLFFIFEILIIWLINLFSMLSFATLSWMFFSDISFSISNAQNQLKQCRSPNALFETHKSSIQVLCIMKPYDVKIINSSKPIHYKYNILIRFCTRKNEKFNFKLVIGIRNSTAISKTFIPVL